ncbi:hypothetical protein ACO1O0_005972 [Amphichorda felina]
MSTQKSILIIGCCAHGISTVLAQELTKRNHMVFIAVPDPSKVSKGISALAAVQTIALDPKSPASASSAAEAVGAATEERGIRGLDVLINDAGVGNSMALLDVIMDSSRDVYDARVSEALSMVGTFADLLARRRGRVVNLSSSGVFIAAPCMGRLAALNAVFIVLTQYDTDTTENLSTKGALTGLSDRLRLELSPWDIDVTCAMLETMPSATDSRSRVFFPQKTSYASFKEAISHWIPGTSRSDEGTLRSLVEWVLEDNVKDQTWLSTYFRGTAADDASKIEKGIITHPNAI